MKCKGYAFVLMLAICITAVFYPSTAVFADTTITVYVDDEAVEFADTQPTIIDNSVFVPARGVFEKLGAEVSWNETYKQARLRFTVKTPVSGDPNRYEIHEFRFSSGNMQMEYFYSLRSDRVEYSPLTLEVPIDGAPINIDGRIMLPLRAVGEALGTEVEWVQESRSVLITSFEELDYTRFINN